MALTTIQANNKLIQFRKDIIREFVRENMFSPYYGDGVNSIIRNIYDAKKGGEQVNVPLVTKLRNNPKGAADTLVGAEEAIDNYGMRVWVDWARHAVSTNDAEEQKDSADVFEEAKPLLSDWGKELQRDELISAFQAIPSESAPANLGGASGGQRVNGILWESADQNALDGWTSHNRDRILFGNDVAHMESDWDWSDSIVKIEAGTDKCTKNSLSLMARMAKLAQPAIRPYKTKDGYDYFVGFCGSLTFRDIRASLGSEYQNAMERGKGNPLFQTGDILYDNVIVREVPEIDLFVNDVWNSSIQGNLLTGGAGGTTRVAPFYLCGQTAASVAWASMPTPTIRKEDDYQFIKGVGVKMCYGIAKTFKKTPSTNFNRQWGLFTGFFASAADTTV